MTAVATPPPIQTAWPTRRLFGVPIQALTMDQVLEIADSAVRARSTLNIGVVNAAKIVNMRRDEELDRAVRESDVILADGMSVVWASRLLRRRLPERVPGIDLMFRLLEHGRDRGYRVYCLGATQEVLDTVVARIRDEYPGVVLAGSHHGYFGPDEEQRVADDIHAARPDILFVAITSPKKERFLARWKERIDVPVRHGVGGSFDVLAGKVRRAPRMWQKLGLEWLFRVIQEPRRMWRRYLVTNTVFCAMVLREMVAGLLPRHAQAGTGSG